MRERVNHRQHEVSPGELERAGADTSPSVPDTDGPGPGDLAPPPVTVVRVDVAGLDHVIPGVSVLAPRHALLANDGRLLLTSTPMVRKAVDIAGLPELIDLTFTGRTLDRSAPRGVPPRPDPQHPVPTIEVHAELTVHADELHPGDVIDYCGVAHLLTRVERGAGLAWPVAYDDTGWAMALGHDVIVLHRTAH